jgi:hypothetical protein
MDQGQGQVTKKQSVHARSMRARCMQHRAQLELRRARAFLVRAVRAQQLAKKTYEDAIYMQQQANNPPLVMKSDVDHDADDFDSIRYVPDSLAGDTYVPDSFEDVEEEASVAAAVATEIEKEREKSEKALAIVRPMMYKICFPSFPELHE